jgi:hypothetical protein
MTRSFTPPKDRRARNVTTFRQGLTGIALVVALAGAAAVAGWLLSLLIAWVY